MWKFEVLERRDAPAVLASPSFRFEVAQPEPGPEPPYGKWYNDMVVPAEDEVEPPFGKWYNELVRPAGSTSDSPVTNSPTAATADRVFATYSEQDLNTDGRVDLTDFAILKTTVHGG
jgi:hypothetical protein